MLYFGLKVELISGSLVIITNHSHMQKNSILHP